MIVMKFGGSSLADATQIDKVLGIVRSRLHGKPMVVCSAHKGITDALLAAAEAARTGSPDPSPVIDRQQKIVADLGGPEDLLAPFFSDLTDLLRGISLVREASPRSLDLVQSFGERMSVRTIADYLQRRGVAARAFDAFELGFITDERFGTARPLPGFGARIEAAVKERVPDGVVPVVTGFVGRSESGEITTVGRNGSDYTASCFAAALRADECQIWTDTDGVMTADPSVLPAARSIDSMSFAEAGELAYYGSRVLHPSTLLPAIERNIPVRVLNTNRPDHPGTVITAGGSADAPPVTSIAYKEHLTSVTIENPRMLGQPGFLARVFEVLGRGGVDVDMVSTSEISVSMTIVDRAALDAVLEELRQHGNVTVEEGKCIVCVVGAKVRTTRGIAARVFMALYRAGVNVEMISEGASKINLSFLIDDSDIGLAVSSLHEALFEKWEALA